MQNFIVKQETRLNKAISEAGFCSRREADKLIENKQVFVNKKAAILGMKVWPSDNIEIKSEAKNLKYVLYNKPRGEVTGIKDKELLKGLHPVGRLDKESEGLLLYTNDHRLVEYLLSPESKIEKEYNVKVREIPTPRVERILLSGITTQEEDYAPVKSVKIYPENKEIKIVLTEGKKHEIRRMLNALNLTIESLKRVRIDHIKLGYLKPSQAKSVEEKILSKLLKQI